jgi:hypothetical protein
MSSPDFICREVEALSSLGTLGSVIYLCGFASGLTMSDSELDRYGAIARSFDTLVWCGDMMSPESFTALIPRIASAAAPPRLLAFKYDEEVTPWLASLQSDPTQDRGGDHRTVDILYHTIPTPFTESQTRDYYLLARAAYDSTNPQSVLALGGGDCVLQVLKHNTVSQLLTNIIPKCLCLCRSSKH